MVLFNGALAARNRAEVMDRLIGGYDVWQQVGRWGSGRVATAAPIPPEGSARVNSGFSEVGATSKGHALVRFNFDIEDSATGTRLMDGWMLLFLLGCGSPDAGKLSPPRIAIPDRAADITVARPTAKNITFDWAVPSGDWNRTHFVVQEPNPAPLTHGPRNMALVMQDAAREVVKGDVSRIQSITVGAMPAPHFPPEPTETRLWKDAESRLLGRLVVPAASRTDGGEGDKTVIDQIEIEIA